MVSIKTLLDILTTVVAVFCLAPVALFLDLPVLLLGGGAIVVGHWCDRSGRYLLPPLPATLLALVGIVYYALQVSRAVEFVLPVVNAMVLLLAVRLLTAKQSRDYLQIFVLALFILAGSSLLSLGIGFIFYLVLLVFVVTVSLVLLTVFVTAPRLSMPHRDLWRLVRVALCMPSASLVLMLGFFVILPRTAHPLWNFLNPASRAVAGLSESVSPGAFARLSSVRSLAFRAEGPELPLDELYWRVLVLNQPQGDRWVHTEPPSDGTVRTVGGRPVTLTIYPEPRNDHYLVTLDRPQLVSGIRSQHSPDQVFRTVTANDHPFRFTVLASPGADLQVSGKLDRHFYLAAPVQVSPRVAEAAAKISGIARGGAAKLAALENFFRDRQLVYAQEDLPSGPDPVDAFLFEKRRGYCEFFAASYVTLARLAGVPARLVGGYYGGEYNPLGGYYLVTDDTAHIWAEVLSDEGLWQRVDPSQWASNAGAALGVTRGSLSPLQRLADTLNYYWIQTVVVFDLSHQLALWRGARVAWRGLSLTDLWLWTGLIAGGLFAVAVAAFFWKHRRRISREEKLLAALRVRAKCRLGTAIALESLDLSEVADRLESEPCREFARIYQRAVFRDRPLDPGEVIRLKALLRQI